MPLFSGVKAWYEYSKLRFKAFHISEYMYKLKAGIYKILQALEQQQDTTAHSTISFGLVHYCFIYSWAYI